MVNPRQQARQRIESRIAELGRPLSSLTPREGLTLVLDAVAERSDSAFLTCSWGRVSRYGNEELGFDVSICFDDGIIELLFNFGTPEVAGLFDRPGAYRFTPFHPEEFFRVAEDLESFKARGDQPAIKVVLTEDDWSMCLDPLFDCWGERDPRRPIVSMTEEEWLCSKDAGLMMRWLRQVWPREEDELDQLLVGYFLACCRRIWPLLPGDLRDGIEILERHREGQATVEQIGRAAYVAEGISNLIYFAYTENQEYDPAYEAELGPWRDQVALIPAEVLAGMLASPRPADDLSPLRVLADTADFVCRVHWYPNIGGIRENMELFRHFLPADLLRERVGNPFNWQGVMPEGGLRL